VVLDPTPEKVNIRRMMIYSLIPLLSIYAGWRIQKFWVLVGINFLAGFVLGFVSDAIFIPLYFVYAISFFINAVITLTVVRYFARKYNEKITGQF
jgi:hypothetical protein